VNQGGVNFCKKHAIVMACYGGQTPIVRAPEKHLPLNDLLSAIRERLEKTCGQALTLKQFLNKWILQKGALGVLFCSLKYNPDSFPPQDIFKSDKDQGIC
jgi:hypothetical protein